MEQNTEQADALLRCVEIAPSYSKITHVTRRVNELLDLDYSDGSSQSRISKRNFPDIGNRAND